MEMSMLMITVFHYKQFFFSVSITGEIKAWLFDNKGSKVDYDAPGFCCTRMAYGADNKRWLTRELVCPRLPIFADVFSILGYFRVGRTKTETPISLNGMSLKDILLGITMD